MKRILLLISLAILVSCSSTFAQEVFAEVEQMPEYPGGQEKLLEYLGKLKKPKKLEKDFTLYVRFLVDTTGEVQEVIIANESETDDEALKQSVVQHVRKMKRWEPGRQKGKPVIVQYVVPYKFQAEAGKE
ncbi:MAG: energy transducer TonB [Chitinophagales bacterium]